MSDENVAEAKAKREKYFINHEREWHPYFEKMESLLSRVNAGWTYFFGSAVHLDIVACAASDRWGNLTRESRKNMVANCREHFLEAIKGLPDGTVILCDGQWAMDEMDNLGLRFEKRPMQLINVRLESGGDRGLLGDLFHEGKKYPVRGWSSYVSHLSAVWRLDLALWVHGTLFPMSSNLAVLAR